MKKIYFLFFAVLLVLVTTIALGQATLPVATNALSSTSLPTGFTVSGLGADYSSPCATALKIDDATDYVQLFFSGTPGALTYDLKANVGSGSWAGVFTIEESADGSVWTTLRTISTTGAISTTGTTSITDNPLSTTRYIKWSYTTKTNGNIAMCNVDLATPLCTAPSVQASFTSVTSITATTLTINFGSGTGSAGRIVVMDATGVITGTPSADYTGATNDFSTTAKTIATNEKVVYVGTGNTVNITGLSANTLYNIKIFEFSGTSCYLTGGSGNTGSATTLCNTPATAASLPIISVITGTTATVTWTNGSGSNRLVLLNASSAPTGIPANGSTYSANPSYTLATVIPTGTGKVLFNGTANTFGVTGLTSNTIYYGVIYEFNLTSKCYMNTGVTFNFNTLSSKSDIISAGGESSCISSLLNNTITTSAHGTEVWQFTIRDGGATSPDVDVLPTIINSIVISQGTSNTVSNWTDIQSAALFDGTTLISSATISSTALTFSGLTYNVLDNTSKTLSLRITLKAVVSSPTTIDNKIFRFSITAANITLAASGSSGKDASAAVATTDVTKDKVCVVATKLVFTLQPSNTVQNVTINPAPKVGAYDANNNLDLGFTSTVTFTSSSTVFSATNLSPAAVNGIATLSGAKYTLTNIGTTLTATAGGLTIVSNTFNITSEALSTTFLKGDFAIIAVNTNWRAAGGGADEISFVVFRDVPVGTVFSMTDNGYEKNVIDKWGATEGAILVTRTGSVLPAGSVVTIRGTGGVSPTYNNSSYEVRTCNAGAFGVDANWTVTPAFGNLVDFNLVDIGDQVWFGQGGSWTRDGTGAANNATFTGNILFGWSGIDWKTNLGVNAPAWTTAGSRMFPKMACFSNSLAGLGATVQKVKYTGLMTATTKLGWAARINNYTNWTTYGAGGTAADQVTYQAGPDYSGYAPVDVCSFPISASTEVEGQWTGGTSTDWFDCNNWDNKIVPDANTSVIIPNAAARASLVDNNSAFAYLASNKADCLDLTIDGKGLSTGASDDVINVNGNFTLKSTGGALDMTNGGIINIQNATWTHTAPATFTNGTGTVAFNAANTQIIPAENFNNLTSTSTGDRILASSGTIGIKGVFTQGSNIYTVTGSTVDFNGSSVQNIPGLITINSSPYTNQYNVLKTSNAGVKTTTGDFTILDNIDIGTGTTLATANEITIESDASKTARVAAVGGIVTYTGSGKFNIERYLPMQTPYSGRRWRLMGVPLSTVSAPTVLASWQEGATVTSSTTDITTSTNPNPGYGTHITNGFGGANNGNGFDAGSTANPSIYKIEPSATAWTPLTTTGDAITNYDAYMLFARGNRSIVVSSPYINTTGSTILRIKGRINVGDITKTIATGKQAISNPYASAISMKNVTYLGASMATTGKTYYVWDPKLLGSKSVGSWVTFSGSGGTAFTSVPKPADSAYMSVYDNVNGTIESGGAIFLNNISGSATTIVFHESDKIATSSTQGIASRPARGNRPMGTVSSLYTNLAYVNGNGDPVLADGVATTYSDEFNNIVDDQDAPKLLTFLTKEKISLLRNDSILAIERRHSITVDDTIFLQMNKLDYSYNYQLQFIGESFAPDLTAFLIDSFLNTETVFSTEGLTRHNFSTNGNEGSIDVNRFKVVFKKLDPLPVKFISINASFSNGIATVGWKIDNEINISSYEVQKSTDGIQFTKIAVIDANGNMNYNFIDENITADINYYRIVSVSVSKVKTYSNIVNIKRVNSKVSITLYSNPLKEDGVVAVQLANMPLGEYTFILYNNLGQIFFRENNIITTRNTTATIRLGILSAKGTYYLKITKPDKSIQIIKVFF